MDENNEIETNSKLQQTANTVNAIYTLTCATVGLIVVGKIAVDWTKVTIRDRRAKKNATQTED